MCISIRIFDCPVKTANCRASNWDVSRQHFSVNWHGNMLNEATSRTNCLSLFLKSLNMPHFHIASQLRYHGRWILTKHGKILAVQID